MAVDRSLVGTKTGTTRVVIERGPVANFARALKDDNPVYHDRAAARAAGFADIPAPPTFGFCMAHWGAFGDIQPADGPDVDRGVLSRAIGELMGRGGLILHGEQEFEYHRPIVVGDVLVGEGEVVDVYEKESKGKTMTFLVTETRYRDDRTGEPVLTTRFNLIHRSG
jgi:acyl dehydratase